MKKLTFFLLFLISISAVGQGALRWRINLGAEVKWFSVAPGGMLITGHEIHMDSTTYTRISGIDPVTGKVTWTFDPDGNDKLISGVDFLPGGTRLQVRDLPLTLLNVDDGRVIFNPNRTNIAITGISSYGFLENDTKLWIDGDLDGVRRLYLFDFEKEKFVWQNFELFDGAGTANKISVGSKTFTSREATTASMLCTPVIRNDHMIAATSEGIFKIELSTGATVWRIALPDPQQHNLLKVDFHQQTIRLITGDAHFYFVKGANIMALTYEEGKPAWPRFVQTSGPIENILPVEKGVILCPGWSDSKGVYGKSRFTMVNDKTSESLWQKEPSFNGTVVRSVATAKGMAVVMKNSFDVNSVNIIDLPTGKFLWSSSVTLSGQLQKLETVPTGLLIHTLRTVNVIGLDGKPVTTFPVQGALKKPVVTQENADRFYYYSSRDNNLYEIDKTNGTGKRYNTTPVNFKGEEPQGIEILEEGVLLSAKQNAVLLLSDGDAKYGLYQPSPGNLIAQLKKDVVEMVTKETAKGGSAKPSPTSNAANYQLYLLTRKDAELTLLVIDKHSGEVVSTVDFLVSDDQPLYKVDTTHNVLFYTPRGKGDFAGTFTHVGEVECWAIFP